jgi:hypothetical protein
LICSFSSRWTILKKAGPIGRLFAERPWLFIANGKGEIGLPVNRLTVEQTDFQSARRRQMKKEKGFRRYGWVPIIGFGRPGGIRTPNTRIWSPVLYQFELLACILIGGIPIQQKMEKVCQKIERGGCRLKNFILGISTICMRKNFLQA